MELYLITEGHFGNLFVGKLEVKEHDKAFKVTNKCMYFKGKGVSKDKIDVFFDDRVYSFDRNKGIEIFKKGVIEKAKALDMGYKDKKSKIEILLEDINEISNR